MKRKSPMSLQIGKHTTPPYFRGDIVRVGIGPNSKVAVVLSSSYDDSEHYNHENVTFTVIDVKDRAVHGKVSTHEMSLMIDDRDCGELIIQLWQMRPSTEEYAETAKWIIKAAMED